MTRMACPPTTVFNTFALWLAVMLLGGCSALSPYSELTKLDLTLTVSDRSNPDVHGRPSPIVVRLLELRHPVAFENADFFSLYERPEQSLGSDLIAAEEMELRPGETVMLKLRVKRGSRYVGVLAAYRDLLGTDWRYTVPLSPAALTEARLTLDAVGIRRTSAVLYEADDR